MDAAFCVCLLSALMIGRVLLDELREETLKVQPYIPGALCVLSSLCLRTILHRLLELHLKGAPRFIPQQRGREPRAEDLLTDHLYRKKERERADEELTISEAKWKAAR